MHHRLKYLTVATVLFPLVTLSPCLPLSSPLVVQAQTRQQPSAEALQLLQIGIQQYKNGALQEALQTFYKALLILKENDNKDTEGHTLNVIGRVYEHLGQYPQALASYKQALEIAKQLGQKSEEATRLGNIGFIYQLQGKYPQALEFYQQALTIDKQISKHSPEGTTLNNIGAVYELQGKYPQALKLYQQALKIHIDTKNKVEEGTTIKNLGGLYRKLKKYSESLSFYQQAIKIYQETNDELNYSETLTSMALVYQDEFKYAKALEFYQQALAISEKSGNKTIEEQNLFGIAQIYLKLWEYNKALEFYQQALAISEKSGNKANEINNLLSIGIVYQSLGKYSMVMKLYQQALSIAKKSGNQVKEGAVLNSFGQLYRRLGEYEKSLKYYQKALAITRKIDDKEKEGITLSNIATVYDELGQHSKALNFYQLALDISQKVDNKNDNGIRLSKIGGTYLNLGQYTKALNSFQQALIIHQEVGNRLLEGGSLAGIGEAYKQLGQYVNALDYYQQALAIIQKIGDKEWEGITLNHLGFLYKDFEQYPSAEKALFTAIEIWELLRTGLADEDKIYIFEKQAETYRVLQQTLIFQNKINSALEVSDRAKARAFIELLASKQLEKLNPLLNIKPLALQQIKNIAKIENATLVQYSIIGNEALYIWVIKPTGEIAFEQVDLEKNLNTSLESLIINNRKTLGARSRGIKVEPKSGGNQKKQLQKLYEILIKPIAQYLPKDSNARVIFIPQESLFLVPFPALQDEQGNYLIDKHTILTAPAIQVLDLTTKQKHNLNKSAKNVLIVGNPIMPKIPITNEQLSSLPGAETEAIQIADLFKTQAIIGSKATETAIVPKMSKARIIHFATHGLLDDFKGFGVPGAIALAPSNQDDGFLTAGEILDMKLNAELIILSACNTGAGKITGDGVIGLSRSFITAGVPSIIVSLWDVNDNSTAFLMSEFYHHLQQNPDKAVALREAMLTTKKRYANPLYWAAFTLIGEAD